MRSLQFLVHGDTGVVVGMMLSRSLTEIQIQSSPFVGGTEPAPFPAQETS